jgi:hypothetical protein
MIFICHVKFVHEVHRASIGVNHVKFNIGVFVSICHAKYCNHVETKVTYDLEFKVTILLVQIEVRFVRLVDLYILATDADHTLNHVSGMDILAVR